jgi:hypothetical protein
MGIRGSVILKLGSGSGRPINSVRILNLILPGHLVVHEKNMMSNMVPGTGRLYTIKNDEMLTDPDLGSMRNRNTSLFSDNQRRTVVYRSMGSRCSMNAPLLWMRFRIGSSNYSSSRQVFRMIKTSTLYCIICNV